MAREFAAARLGLRCLFALLARFSLLHAVTFRAGGDLLALVVFLLVFACFLGALFFFLTRFPSLNCFRTDILGLLRRLFYTFVMPLLRRLLSGFYGGREQAFYPEPCGTPSVAIPLAFRNCAMAAL